MRRLLTVVSLLCLVIGLGAVGLLRIPAETRCQAVEKLEPDWPVRYCLPADQLLEIRNGLDDESVSIRAAIAEAEKNFEAEVMQRSYGARVRREHAQIAEPETVIQLRLQWLATVEELHAATQIIDLYRNMGQWLSQLQLLLTVPAILLLLLWRPQKKSRTPRRFVVSTREEACSEARAHTLLAGLHRTSQDAAQFLIDQQPIRCAYCEKKLPKFGGMITKITLIKETPLDVKKERRIVLGVGYEAKSAGQYVCPACGHNNYAI